MVRSAQATTQPVVPTGKELENLLSPVSISDFLENYADRKALLIKGKSEKFAQLKFDKEAFFSSCNRFGNVSDRLKVALRMEEGEHENYEAIFPFQARNLFENGMTICCAGISDANETLAAFSEGVRLSLCVPDLRFNSYLSPHDSGFNLHYDVQAIFLMQTQGKKNWWYSKEPISPAPTVYSSKLKNKLSIDELETCVLEPGDVLYLPAFSWHRARADNMSLGITLGIKGLHNQPLRDAVDASPFSGDWPYQVSQPQLDARAVPVEGTPEAVTPYLQQQLKDFQAYVDNLTEADLWSAWIREVNQPKGPVLPAHPVNLMRNNSLKRSKLFPVNLLPTTLEDGSRGIEVLHACHRAVFPEANTDLLRFLLAYEEVFIAGDVPKLAGLPESTAWLDYEGVLRRLATMRVLEKIR